VVILLTQSFALPVSDNLSWDLSNAALTVDVLEELAERIRSSASSTYEGKRSENENMEYSRKGRHGVGSKLLALKQAADWNGLGRKKREAGSH